MTTVSMRPLANNITKTIKRRRYHFVASLFNNNRAVFRQGLINSRQRTHLLNHFVTGNLSPVNVRQNPTLKSSCNISARTVIRRYNNPFANRTRSHTLNNHVNTNLTLTNGHNLKQSIRSKSTTFLRVQRNHISRLMVIDRITIGQFLRLAPDDNLRVLIIILSNIVRGTVSVTMLLMYYFSSTNSLINIIRIGRIRVVNNNMLLSVLLRLIRDTIKSVGRRQSNPLLNRLRHSTFTSTFRTTNSSSSFTFRVRVRKGSFIRPCSTFRKYSVSHPTKTSTPRPR